MCDTYTYSHITHYYSFLVFSIFIPSAPPPNTQYHSIIVYIHGVGVFRNVEMQGWRSPGLLCIRKLLILPGRRLDRMNQASQKVWPFILKHTTTTTRPNTQSLDPGTLVVHNPPLVLCTSKTSTIRVYMPRVPASVAY